MIPVRLALLLAAALPLAACTPAATRPAAAITDGEQLVRAMHDRYAGRWYNTLTFTQKTTRRLPNDSVRVETWREYGAMPGRLRIEFGPRENNNGVIYANDSSYVVRGGRVVARRPGRNALMILGFDVYALAPEQSVRILREEHFPMTPVRMETYQGRPTWVVGGAPGDMHSHQFWVDAERLVYVRSFEPFAGDTTKTMDVRFDGYERFGGGWVSTVVDILVDGRSIQKEEYSDVRVNVPLDPALWIPERWADAPHPQ
ncbi:MAG: hypothetical protein ACJ8GN_18860 [Longimicrobiaceae bacterium]